MYRGVLGWTIDIHSADNSGEGTDKPEQGTSFSVFKKSNKEKAADYDVTRFKSGQKQSRDSLSTDKATTKAWSAVTLWKPKNVMIVSSCGGFFRGEKRIRFFGRLNLCISQ